MVLWFAPDLLAVWSHLSGVGRATFICCLLVTVGASLAARWGDSLRVFLLLLLHLLYNFPDLALCGLQWREGWGGHREETIPVLRPHRKQRVWGLGKEKLGCSGQFHLPQVWQSRAEFLSTSPQACRVQGKGGSEQAWGEWQARVHSKGPGWEAAAEVSNGGEG